MTRAGIYDAEKWYKIKDAQSLLHFRVSVSLRPLSHLSVTFPVQVTAQTAISEVFANDVGHKKAAKFPRHAKNVPGKKKQEKLRGEVFHIFPP